MTKVVIWGTGKFASCTIKDVLLDKCNLIGFVDNDIQKQNTLWNNKFHIYSLEKALELSPDYYLVSAMYGRQSIISQAKEFGIKDRLIWYWKDDLDKYDFIKNNSYLKENILLKMQIEKMQRQINNASFEYGKKIVKIKSSRELLEKILTEKCSLCRFGDGEFDIMLNHERAWFQKCNAQMGERLKEVLNSSLSNIIIAIADNYGNLDKYTDGAADAIRKYMTKEKRKEHMELLDISREYYDAYVSRPYMMYKNKDENAKLVFGLYKSILSNRNILIVEGKSTRNGWNNNLFSSVKSIRRILCPDSDSFDYYNEILQTVMCHVNENDLVLISLGPTATILAYDLAREGIQAIDFGQMDNEYEWYNMHAMEHVIIPGKSVSEILWYKTPKKDIHDEEYLKQIVAIVE